MILPTFTSVIIFKSEHLTYYFAQGWQPAAFYLAYML
jgi:hypothetical protein